MADAPSAEVTCTWLGHAAFQLEHNGHVVLVDPYLEHPKLKEKGFQVEKVNAILVSHDHPDSVGSTKELSEKHNAKVYCIQELAKVFVEEGLSQDLVVGLNKGGTVDVGGGFRATMVNAVHSSQVGTPAGWVVSCQNGHAIYHTGDTDAFADMSVISDVYKPDVALICIGGYETMGPTTAAYALNSLLTSVKIAVPMRFGTRPELPGTPAELAAHITRKDVNVTRLEPGESFSLTGRSVKELF